MERLQPPLRIDLFLKGRRYGTRRWHVCPRVGDLVGVDESGGKDPTVTKVYQVERVVYLRDTTDAAAVGFQEIDIYLKAPRKVKESPQDE